MFRPRRGRLIVQPRGLSAERLVHRPRSKTANHTPILAGHSTVKATCDNWAQIRHGLEVKSVGLAWTAAPCPFKLKQVIITAIH